MSIDDRTPGTREVRSMYCAGSNLYRETPEQHYLGAPAPDYGAEFDRFLDQVRRETLDSLIEDTEIDLQLGVSGNDYPRIQNAEAVIDAATIYRDTEYESGDSDD